MNPQDPRWKTAHDQHVAAGAVSLDKLWKSFTDAFRSDLAKVIPKQCSIRPGDSGTFGEYRCTVTDKGDFDVDVAVKINGSEILMYLEFAGSVPKYKFPLTTPTNALAEKAGATISRNVDL